MIDPYPIQEWCHSLVSITGEWTETKAEAAFCALKPGAHGAVGAGPSKGSHHLAWLLESTGFEIRDVIAVLSTDGSEDWLLVRKPIEGTVAKNVLKHGAGALNIDAARIATGGESFSVPQSDPAKRAGIVGTDLGISGADREAFHAAQRASVERTATLGRWPANLALIHGSGCQAVGEKRVASSTLLTTHTLSESPNVAMSGGNYARNPRRDYAPDGKETVTAWNCEPGCPVRSLDEMSGTLTSGVGRVGAGAGSRADQAVFNPGKGGNITSCFADTGGASRFFKCAADRGELLRWFVRLVCPPGALFDPFASPEVAVAAAMEGIPLAIPVAVSLPEPVPVAEHQRATSTVVPVAEQLRFDL